MTLLASQATRLRWLFMVASVVACGAPTPTAAPSQVTSRQERPLRDPAESLQRLEDSVTEVESATDPLAGRQLAGVVQALARSVEPLSHASRLRLEALASRIGGAPVRSLPQAGLLKETLQVLLEMLTRVPATPSAERAYHEALRRLAESREQLDELRLLDDQRPQLGEALRAAANATFLARGGEPPFRLATPSTREKVALGPFSEQLARARRDIAEVARIPLMGSRLASARALASLADMIAAADTQQLLTQQVGELRFQATRLERATEASPGRAGWIRAGLRAAVDALTLANGGQRSPWIDEAQRAVVGIDERSAPSFQRAAIQDALRATVDAFAALAPASSRGPSQL